MTKLTLAKNVRSVTGKSIDSQALLVMVNDARRQCGEPPVRNNKFVEKIEDELEGEFYTKSAKPSGANGGRPVEVIEMTFKQSLRVAARESRAVRRSLVDKLEAMHETQIANGKSASGLVEYRQARTLKLTVEAVTSLFDLMPQLAAEAKQTAAASLINPIAGFEAIPLPVIEEKHYSAGEVGEMLDVSANKIGRIANANNLKTEEFGKFFLDKSAHSAKQVEAFRYNSNGVEALRHLIHGADVA
jgi:hypothetical protein